jgi:hypothetical protein
MSECDVCFEGSELSALLFQTDLDGTKHFQSIAALWQAGTAFTDYATYYNRVMIHIRCRTRGSCTHCASITTAKEKLQRKSTRTSVDSINELD